MKLRDSIFKGLTTIIVIELILIAIGLTLSLPVTP